MEGYVGFANLPNQVFRKSVKKGFEFTVMVVGKRYHCAVNGSRKSFRLLKHVVVVECFQSLCVHVSFTQIKTCQTYSKLK